MTRVDLLVTVVVPSSGAGVSISLDHESALVTEQFTYDVVLPVNVGHLAAQRRFVGRKKDSEASCFYISPRRVH